jgi:hypothetical protein
MGRHFEEVYKKSISMVKDPIVDREFGHEVWSK